MEWVKALVARLTKDLAHCSPKTLASVAWALACLDCHPHPRWMAYLQQARARAARAALPPLLPVFFPRRACLRARPTRAATQPRAQGPTRPPR